LIRLHQEEHFIRVLGVFSMASELAPCPSVTERVFRAVQRVDVAALAQCCAQPDGGGDEDELRPVLASLVRMSLIASLDKSRRCSADRTAVLQVLSKIEVVNNLVALLSIDFHALESDVRKEQKQLTDAAATGSVASASSALLGGSLSLGPALEFERSDATRRLRLVLAELLTIMGAIQAEEAAGGGTAAATNVKERSSELFDHPVYLSEVCDVLCIAMAELPALLVPTEVCEALLRLKYGPWIICHVVANQPDCFLDGKFS